MKTMRFLAVAYTILSLLHLPGSVAGDDGRGVKPREPELAGEGGRLAEGFTVSGDSAEIVADASADTSPRFILREDGSSLWYIDASHLDDTLYLRGSNSMSRLSIDQSGAMTISFSGSSGPAISATATTSAAIGYFRNQYAGDTWGLSAGCSSTSAGENSYGVYGYNYGLGNGVYGKAYNAGGTGVYALNDDSDSEGYLGGSDYAFWASNDGQTLSGCNVDYALVAENGASNNEVKLAGADNAIFARYGSDGNVGKVGTMSYGLYGYLASENGGNYAIYGYGPSGSAQEGTSYTAYTSLGGVKGYCFFGNAYTFAVGGFSQIQDYRSGATIGANTDGLSWGTLAYKNSGGTIYGGYFTSYTTGGGDRSLAPRKENCAGDVGLGIGLAASGNVMGAWVRGGHGGLYVQGDRWAQVTDGDAYTTGCNAVIQTTDAGVRVATYQPASLSADVYAYGVGQLDQGRAEIDFEPRFSDIVSSESPVVVTTTPIGQGAALFLDQVDHAGFVVGDASDAGSTVMFTWIAIGKRRGYERHQPPAEVMDADFDANMDHATRTDADTKHDALGIFLDGDDLRFGDPPVEPVTVQPPDESSF